MEKVLSVIIPTYNMERYLEKCLSSLVIDQSEMDSLDIIVVNDGSKDGSLQIAQSFVGRYPDSITVIDKENGNYGSCINRGLKVARGKYVKVLDADDSFDNAVFTRFVSYLKTVDVDLVINDFSKVDEAGNETGFVGYDLPDGEFALDAFKDGFEYIIAMHAVTYRTDNLRKIGYVQTEGVSYTDMQWIFHPMSTVKTAVHFKQSLYRYLFGREGQTVDPKVYLKNYRMNIPVLAKMVESYESCIDSCDGNQKRYMEKLLLRRLEHLYNYYLLSTHKYLDQIDLVEFDKLLGKVSSRLCGYTDKISLVRHGVHFAYVHEWRRHYSRKTLPFRLYDLYIRLSK